MGGSLPGNGKWKLILDLSWNLGIPGMSHVWTRMFWNYLGSPFVKHYSIPMSLNESITPSKLVRGFLQKCRQFVQIEPAPFPFACDFSLSSDPHPSRWIISPNHTPTFPPSVCLVTSTLPPIFGLNFRFPTEFWQKLIFLSLSFQPPTLIFTHWSTAYSNHYTTICLDWLWIFT